MPDGSRRKILLPLVPEYIGYANQGVGGDLFRAVTPLIEKTGPHEFKYRVDFDHLEVTPDIAAICASRPTNPTGNVLTDDEIARLSALAKQHGIPLIIDNAYGAPFPGIIFADATPFWDQHVILTLSLSKLGLPGTRTGIVIGPPEIIRALGSMSAIVGLSNPNIGQQITLPLIQSGEILRLSREVVRPFYQEKCRLARQAADGGLRRRHRLVHAPQRGRAFPLVLVSRPADHLPGTLRTPEKTRSPRHPRPAFLLRPRRSRPGAHRHECIRVSYAMDEAVVRDGLRIIAEEVRLAGNA